MPISSFFPKEQDVLKSILDYLQIKGYFCFRNNTGAMRSVYKGKERFFRYGLTGSGDILGLTKEGRFFSIEVKAKGNKPTAHQQAFIQRVNANKGLAFVAYSLDDVTTFL